MSTTMRMIAAVFLCFCLAFLSHSGFGQSKAQKRPVVSSNSDSHSSAASKDQLFLDAANGNVHDLARLVACGVDVNATDSYSGDTVLAVAAQAQQISAMRYLLHHGAGVNSMGKSNWGMPALGEARSIQVVRVLLHAGADPNEKIGMLEDKTPFDFAIMTHEVGIVKLLLRHGANVYIRDRDGNQPLMLVWGPTEPFWYYIPPPVAITRMLIARGAPVNSANKRGLTPLMEAVNSHDVQIAEILFAHGARVNQRDIEGNTPLMCLRTSFMDEDYCKELEKVDYDASRLTQAAIRLDRALPMAKLLLQHGANLTLRNQKGETVLTLGTWEANQQAKEPGIHTIVGVGVPADSNEMSDPLLLKLLQTRESILP